MDTILCMTGTMYVVGLGISPPYLPQPTNSIRQAIYQGEEKNEALFLYYSELKKGYVRFLGTIL